MRKTKVGPMLDARLEDKSEFKGNSIVAEKDYFEAKFHISSIILQKRNILSLFKKKITKFLYIKKINLNHHDTLQYEKALKIFYFDVLNIAKFG